MGFFDDVIDIAVNTVVTPVNIITDVTGSTKGKTEEGLKKVAEGVVKAPEDLLGGDL